MKAKIGIYNLHLQAMGGGERLTLVMAEHLSFRHNVWLFSPEPVDVLYLERFFDVDLSRVKVVILKAAGRVPRLFARLRGMTGAVQCREHYNQLLQFKLDLFINNSYGSTLRCPAARGIFMCMFPHADASMRSVIDTYETIVAISEYSAEWIRRRWKRSSEIVYPPCDDMGPAPPSKEKVILHVGRFIADSDQDERHHKGQRLLLAAFKQLPDLHRAGWELHLAGSLGSNKMFADSLVQAADGLPIVFHFNASREQLRDLYSKAAIYWQATGYGFDAKEYPGKQEHFGISTVEAMSAGAVPVVYASGGQQEIVTNEVDGLWWTRIDELLIHTRRLVTDRDVWGQLSRAAIRLSKRFSREVFFTRMDQVIG